MPEIPRPVPIKFWGKDHWSTLAYVETCCVDRQGELSPQKMRCDAKRHPEKALSVFRMSSLSDGSQYPTRLYGGVKLHDHDDWDCLEDMEAAGLLEVVSWVNSFVTMTDKGFEVAGALRRHRARTGGYKDFVWEENK